MSPDVHWWIYGSELERLACWASERLETGPSISSRRYVRSMIEEALRRADCGTWSPALLPVLERLQIDPARAKPAQSAVLRHAVHVPLVDEVHGRALIRDFVWTSRSSPTRVDAEAHAAIDEAARSASHDLGRTIEGQLVLAAPVPIEVRGASVGAGAYVAAMARLTGRAVRTGLAITGVVRGSDVLAVGHLDRKTDAAQRRGLRLVDPRTVHTTGELLEVCLEPERPSLQRLLDDLESAFKSGWQGYVWPAVHERALATLDAIPETRPELRVKWLAKLAASARHTGKIDVSLRALDDAKALIAAPRGATSVPDPPRIQVLRQEAMTRLQLLELKESRRTARASVALARRARLRRELIPSLGTLGLVEFVAGRAPEALAAQLEALEIVNEFEQDPTRTLAYLVEAHGLASEASKASLTFQHALETAKSDDDQAWVRVAYASALLQLDAPTDASAILDHSTVDQSLGDPLPGIRARRVRALALLASPSAIDRRHALSLLENTPAAFTDLGATLLQQAHVNVLFAWHARLRAGERLDPAWLTTLLEHCPPHSTRERVAAHHPASFERYLALAGRLR